MAHNVPTKCPGGGRGGTRRGAPEENTRYSGREEHSDKRRSASRERDRRERDRGERGERDRADRADRGDRGERDRDRESVSFCHAISCLIQVTVLLWIFSFPANSR